MSEDVEDRLERLYRIDGARLWRAILAHMGDPDLADEVVAETFAQAIRRGEAIQDVSAWVWRTAFRIALGMLKERDGYRGLDERGSYEMPERAWDVIAALSALPPKQRAAIVLHHYAGYPIRETAHMIGSTPAAVKVHLSVGRKRLRRLLEEEDG